eukprot:7727830-Alexandrium_andersonii.AAC.1
MDCCTAAAPLQRRALRPPAWEWRPRPAGYALIEPFAALVLDGALVLPMRARGQADREAAAPPLLAGISRPAGPGRASAVASA